MAELEAAVSAYQAALTAQAVEWLLERGLGLDEASMYRLGVAADPFPGHEKYTGMLALPYLDRDGNPLTMRFRCLQQHDHRTHGHGKYMSLPHEPARTFNVSAVHDAGDDLHIAEGEFDGIVLTKAGFPAISIPGAQGWRPHHRRMVAGFSRVFVWGDPDEAGAEFAAKVTRSVRNATGVRMTRDDGDVSDLYVRGGREALCERLAAVSGEAVCK